MFSMRRMSCFEQNIMTFWSLCYSLNMGSDYTDLAASVEVHSTHLFTKPLPQRDYWGLLCGSVYNPTLLPEPWFICALNHSLFQLVLNSADDEKSSSKVGLVGEEAVVMLSLFHHIFLAATLSFDQLLRSPLSEYGCICTCVW